MLTVTEDAKSHLADIIDKSNLPDEASIRLVAGPDGIGLAPDKPKETDQAYEHNGKTVLVVAPELQTQLDDKTMSIQETENGKQLSIA
ncbi:MAG: hypothetical protein ACF8Q5_08820 [Phycisphaerales bacterium JB040]